MLFILFSCKDPEIRWHDITKIIQGRHQIESVQDFSYEHLTEQEWIDFFCIMYLISNGYDSRIYSHSSYGIMEKSIRFTRFKKELRIIETEKLPRGEVIDLKNYIRKRYKKYETIHTVCGYSSLIPTNKWLRWWAEGLDYDVNNAVRMNGSLWKRLCKKVEYSSNITDALLAELDYKEKHQIKGAIVKYKKYVGSIMKLNIEELKDKLDQKGIQ